MLTRLLLILFTLAALSGTAFGQTVTATADRLSIGGTREEPGTGTSARLQDLATSGTSDGLIFGESDGDLFKRLLTASDIPTSFTQRNVAEGISSAWSFNGGLSTTTLSASGATTLGSTLGVTGATTLSSTLGVTGASTLTGGFSAGTNSSVAGNLSLTGTGNLTATGDVGSSTYTSQTTGWRVTNAGAADVRYLYTDELHAKAFIADLEVALNGGQIIAKSTTILYSAFTCPAAGGTATLTVKDFPGFNNVRVFADGDWVVLRSFSRTDADNDGNTDLTIGDCVGQVSSYADDATEGTQTWTFTRGSGGNAGAMATSTVVAADAVVIDYGVSGQGFLVARANDGAEGVNAPYWQTVTWTGAPVTANMTLQTRWGQLNGAYGYGSSTYGFATGNPSGVWLGVEPTNGLRVMSGSTTRMQIDPTGSQKFFTTDGTLIGQINSTFGILFGDWANVGGSYIQIGSNVLQFCRVAPAGCPLVFSGSTGDITSTGNIYLSGGGTLASSGNFSLGTSQGLRFERWAGTTVSEPRSITFYNGGSLSAVIGQDSNGAVRINSRTSGSGTGIRLQLAAYSASGVEPGVFLTKETSGTTDITNVVVQAAATNAGNPTEIRFVPLHGSLGGAATSYIGSLSNPWSTVYTNGLLSSADATYALGSSSNRWSNIHLALPNETTPGYVVVGNSSVDGTRLAYIVGVTGTYWVQYDPAGDMCTMTFRVGLLTGTTC